MKKELLRGRSAGSHGVLRLEWRGHARLDAYPLQLAPYAALRIDAQVAGETLRIDVAAALERLRDAEGIEPECEQSAALRG